MILSYSQSARLVLFFLAYALSFPTMINCVVVLRASERIRWREDALAAKRLESPELEGKQVNLQVLDQNINTNDATGRLLSSMLGAIAQFETGIRAERQREAIAKAKQKGVKFGAQRKLTQRQVKDCTHQ